MNAPRPFAVPAVQPPALRVWQSIEMLDRLAEAGLSLAQSVRVTGGDPHASARLIREVRACIAFSEYLLLQDRDAPACLCSAGPLATRPRPSAPRGRA